MSAPKRPVATGRPRAATSAANALVEALALAGAAAAEKPGRLPRDVRGEGELAHDEGRPPTSPSERFIRPASSRKMRSLASRSARAAGSASSSPAWRRRGSGAPAPTSPTPRRRWRPRPRDALDQRPHTRRPRGVGARPADGDGGGADAERERVAHGVLARAAPRRLGQEARAVERDQDARVEGVARAHRVGDRDPRRGTGTVAPGGVAGGAARALGDADEPRAPRERARARRDVLAARRASAGPRPRASRCRRARPSGRCGRGRRAWSVMKEGRMLGSIMVTRAAPRAPGAPRRPRRGLAHEGDAAEEQGLDLGAERGQVVGREHPAGGVLVVEGVGGVAVPEAHEGERGGRAET